MRNLKGLIRQTKAPSNVYYGWWLVGVAIFTFTFVVGPTFQGIGTFFVVLERQFNWSRTSLSIAFSLGRVEGALLGPIEGVLTDRIGARRVVFVGFLVLSVGLIGFSLIRNIVDFYIAFLVIFTGAGLAGFIPFMAAINNWFLHQRSTATGLAMSGMNLGGLLVPVLAWSVVAFSWQATAQVMGIAVLVLAIPISQLVRNRPEDYGQHVGDSISSTNTIDEDPSSQEVNFTALQAVKTSAFWAIAIAHGLGATAFVTITIHIMPALTDTGMSLQMASTIVALYTGSGAVFQLIGGFLGDRFPKPPIIAAFLLIQGIALIFIASDISTINAYIFSILFGVGTGGRVPVLVSIRGDYFGRKSFGTILGLSQLPMNIIMMVAPVGAGYLYDIQGSYFVPFMILAVMCFFGAIIMLFCHKPTPPTDNKTNSNQASP